jgi:hypothetical protein
MTMKRIVRAAFTASLLCAAASASSLLGAATVLAADSKSDEKVSPAVGKQLMDAKKAIEAKDYATALASVKAAQAVPDRTLIDDYRINQFLAIVAFNLKDIPTATTAMEAAADSPAMPAEDKPATYRNAFGLAAAAKQYDKAIAYGLALEALAPLDDSTDLQVALIYYNMKDAAHAQQYAQKAIDLDKAAGKQPDPDALRIVMNGQVQKNDMSGIEASLENLVLADPDHAAASWRDLVNLAFQDKGANEIDAMFLYRLKVLAGAMTDADDYTTLASSDEEFGYPTEAVDILQKGIASGKVSSGQVAEQLAKERKDAALDSRELPEAVAGAAKSKNGEADVKLGEDYWGYGRFADAEAAARRAIAKGGLKHPSEGLLLAAAALVAQGKYAEGIQAFAQISGTPATMKVAHLWTIYAQGKQKQAPAPAAPAPAPAK